MMPLEGEALEPARCVFWDSSDSYLHHADVRTGICGEKGRFSVMMQKIQKFGGAMYTPAILFAFSGIVVGLGTLFTTEAIFGSLAVAGNPWYDCWNVLLQGGWTLFNQMPLLFCVALPITLATHQQARACMEALAAYLTFNYFVNTILAQWGGVFGVDFSVEAASGTGLATIASIKTLDMGMMGALIISGITVMLHNKFFDTELPDWLGVFGGSVFVYAVSFFVMLPCAIIACAVWPPIQHGIQLFQGFILSTGAMGVWVFAFLERILIPTGLHHFIYTPFYYADAAVSGGIYPQWATILPTLAASGEPLAEAAPWAAYTCPGWTKVFGSLGVCIAFYLTAKPERRKETKTLLIPVGLTAMLCGITEPLDFTFLFIAPQLFVVHSILGATLCMVQNLVGTVGIFDGGIISMASWDFLPLGATYGLQYLLSIAIGLAFSAIWVVVFRFLILKFDFKTPGREDDDVEVSLKSKAEFKAAQSGAAASKEVAGSKAEERKILAENILDLLGGRENVIDVTNCATRLRVNVHDESLVAPEANFKAIGTHGIAKNGKNMQVIIGLSVPRVRDVFEQLL